MKMVCWPPSRFCRGLGPLLTFGGNPCPFRSEPTRMPSKLLGKRNSSRWPPPAGSPRPDLPPAYIPLPRGADRQGVADAFAAARAVPTSDYLALRGLSRDTLSDPRFAGTWKEDRRGSVLFAHRDDAGEIKSRLFTGFSPGGVKSAWQSAALPADRALVITESAIDALSHYQLHRDERAESRYLSTAGAPSARQVALLDRTFAGLSPAMTVVAAVDADDAGHALAAKLELLTRRHTHIAFRRDAPSRDKDWNDVLQRLARERRLGLGR